MGKTHIAVGVATAILVVQPDSAGSLTTAIAGGAIGGVISDIDVKTTSHPSSKDGIYSRILGICIAFVAIFIGHLCGSELLPRLMTEPIWQPILACVIFAVTLVFMRKSKHRTFSHSIIALLICSIGIALINVTLAIAFGVGFMSHILLDMLNKQKVYFLSPLAGGYCLSVFYANKIANKVILVIALVVDLFLITYSVARFTGLLNG